jgi:histidyl-tRNA synthetase
MTNNNAPLQTLKGFRDFLPEQMRQRNYVRERIVGAFAQFGFQPLETPTLEYKETIMGKYGAEADKLVYQFTDNGDREVALRYDQTVPTARVMAQYRNELPLPFRRYQVQNVFRADKPQRGRYREFMQCDIDIFGSTDALADAEVLATVNAAYSAVGFTNFAIKVNDRQTLVSTLEPFATSEVSVMSIIQTIDKLDKISADNVVQELANKGLPLEQAQQALSSIQDAKPSAALEEILKLARSLGVPSDRLVYQPTLARGLDYYTGLIFEIMVDGYRGSLGAGGRYDNLVEQLSGYSVPAVGFAVGFDRTLEVALELGLVPAALAPAEFLVTVFDDTPELRQASAQVAAQLRAEGKTVELYPQSAKIGKQLKYASTQGIPKAVIIGSDELAAGRAVIKDLLSGEQTTLPLL